jgi:hypothetical protein
MREYHFFIPAMSIFSSFQDPEGLGVIKLDYSLTYYMAMCYKRWRLAVAPPKRWAKGSNRTVDS